jgi:pimeloyl-ACP methyl ester carboxylesterase
MTRRVLRLIGALAALIALSTFALPSLSSSAGALVGGPKPTVVLVHGSFADASGWNGVIERLSRDGYPVLAPANPLRSLSGDSAYLASVLKTIPGPVVLVGHSYGGAVISNAATQANNVKALVYVAAFALDKGESAFGTFAVFPGSQLPLSLKVRPYQASALGVTLDSVSAAGDFGLDGYIDPDRFHEVFCADLPATTAAAMAASQRPSTVASGVEPSGEPAWKTIPSWYMVAKQDRVIPPDAERFMAKRAGAHTVEIDSSHVAMTSNPDAVTDLIRSAAAGTR